METEQVYKVTTDGDCEGRTISTLGYARGNPEDIKVFYNDKKCYEIRLEPITVATITPKSVAERRALLEERVQIQQILAEIEKIVG